MEELKGVKLRPTETKLRQRDGQVLKEKRSADGIEQEVVGQEAPPQYMQDQALGLSRLAGKVFDGQRWVAYEVSDAAAALNGATALLRVLTYNVWFSDFRQKERAKALFAILEDADADIICLQEVTPCFLTWLRQEPFVQEGYVLSDVLGTTLQGSELAYGVLLLLKRTLHATELQLWQLPSRMCRSLLVAKLPMEDVELLVATVHLESNCQDLRREQLRQILRYLDAPTSHVILAGDMNFGDFAVEEVELRQADYHDCTASSGHTMPRNDFDGKACRLDRIYTHESAGAVWRLVPSAPRLLGTEPLDEGGAEGLAGNNHGCFEDPGDALAGGDSDTDPEMPPLIPVAFGEIPLPMSRCPSDHYGVLCDFEIVRRKAHS